MTAQRASWCRLRPDRMGAAIYYNGLRCLGLTAAGRRLRDAGLILCYHNVVSGADGAYGHPVLHQPIERFERQMRWLARRYDVVPLGEFVHRLTTGRSLRSVAAVTFDDAYAGVYEHAMPVLHALGMPATVFVVGEAPGRDAGFWWDRPGLVRTATPERREIWLKELRGDGRAIVASDACGDAIVPASYRAADWSEICAALRRGIDVGVHSASHRSLTTLTDDELDYEVVASRAIVQRATGIRPEFFAYPYGVWDARVRLAVRSAGYRAALTLDDGWNAAGADPWCLRRINVPAGLSCAALEAWTAGFSGLNRA